MTGIDVGSGGDEPLEVVIVAYGDPEPLQNCLAGLDRQFPLTVVDNSSLPATRQLVREWGGRYLDPGRNLGFGAGVNYALAELEADSGDILLLNPDAQIRAAEARTLHRRLLEDPALACVAPAQVHPGGVAARVCWPFPSPGGAWLEAVGLGRLGRQRCDFLIGSVLLLSGRALQSVGGFDERFFLYAEETDWQLRATRRGWKVALCPEITAVHIGAGTGGDPDRRRTFFYASHERFLRKHYGDGGWALYRAGNLIGAGIRAMVLSGDRGREAAARFRLMFRGPCRAEQQYRQAEGHSL